MQRRPPVDGALRKGGRLTPARFVLSFRLLAFGLCVCSYNFEFGNLLSAIERGSYDGVAAAQCSGKNFTVDAIGQHFGKYQLPSSCTAAGYNAGGACLLALPQSAFDVTLQLAVQRCPGVAAGATSKLPSVSLTCSGNGCKDLLVPCNTDSDCSGSVCTAFTSTTAAQIGAAFSAALNSTGLMPAASAQCTNDYKSNAGLKVFQAFSKAVGASLTGGNGVNAHEKTGFCGVAKYMPVELAGFSLRSETQAPAGTCGSKHGQTLQVLTLLSTRCLVCSSSACRICLRSWR
jgi:hypothetical protein